MVIYETCRLFFILFTILSLKYVYTKSDHCDFGLRFPYISPININLTPLQKVEELVDSVKKARGLKTKERNKDKLSDEERDARKDRKLGRKRDRIEESGGSDHKRRREGETFTIKLLFKTFKNDRFPAQNGDDDLRERDRHRVSMITNII